MTPRYPPLLTEEDRLHDHDWLAKNGPFRISFLKESGFVETSVFDELPDALAQFTLLTASKDVAYARLVARGRGGNFAQDSAILVRTFVRERDTTTTVRSDLPPLSRVPVEVGEYAARFLDDHWEVTRRGYRLPSSLCARWDSDMVSQTLRLVVAQVRAEPATDPSSPEGEPPTSSVDAIRPEDEFAVLLPVRAIPDRATVTKKTGESRYVLRRSITVYPRASSDAQKLVLDGYYLVSPTGDVNQVGPETVLAWRVTADDFFDALTRARGGPEK